MDKMMIFFGENNRRKCGEMVESENVRVMEGKVRVNPGLEGLENVKNVKVRVRI